MTGLTCDGQVALVAAVLVTETLGITEPGLTAEVVRDRLPEILDPQGAIVSGHIGDELGKLFAALPAAPA